MDNRKNRVFSGLIALLMLLAGCSLTGAAEPDSSSVSGQASHTEAKTSDITVPGTEPMQTESATVTIDASGEGTNRMFYAHVNGCVLSILVRRRATIRG